MKNGETGKTKYLRKNLGLRFVRPSVRLSVPHKASSPTRVLLLLGLPQHQDVLNSFVVAFTVDFCRLFINIFPHNGTLLVLRIPPLLLLLSDPRPLNFFPDIILMIYMCIDFLSGNKFHSREIYCAKPSPTGLPLPYNPPGFPSLSLSLSLLMRLHGPGFSSLVIHRVAQSLMIPVKEPFSSRSSYYWYVSLFFSSPSTI